MAAHLGRKELACSLATPWKNATSRQKNCQQAKASASTSSSYEVTLPQSSADRRHLKRIRWVAPDPALAGCRDRSVLSSMLLQYLLNLLNYRIAITFD
ncbi:hypothetical protein I6F21_06465 [Bradyrhizobium sp. NBAIM03]|uniref:hypothetical protein n=1 Tax=unclassified Bradyrhizobium TaxID=2631580 RepID=UPI0011B20AF4|nr:MULTISPECIES: hypothetical protein [unclassified Bradyrhizobium]MCA1393377.1 hypothetical protein [Bradyrhizobium sp. IC3123]MCA1532203.1 hypothetical protein [Bradyrhizobium sp. NBAIM03]